MFYEFDMLYEIKVSIRKSIEILKAVGCSEIRISNNATSTKGHSMTAALPHFLPRLSTRAFMHFALMNVFIFAPLISRADFSEGDYTYTVTNNQATITDFNSSYSGALYITNALGGYPVTSIGFGAFFSCSLTTVTIPDSVTSIGDSAFDNCYDLTSVTFYNDLSSFRADDVFYPRILENVVIGSGVTSIGFGAFYNCDGLTNLVIGSSVTSIGEGAFDGCIGLTSVTIPNSVTSIADEAFCNCEGLTNVVIGSGVTFIGNDAFSLCYGLTTVTIPASVIDFCNDAFSGCSGLIAITVDPANTEYASSEGGLFSKDFTTLILYPNGQTGTYAIPDFVTSIGDFAFSHCSGLTFVTIPDLVTFIGNGAFEHCDGLTSVLFQGTPPTLGGSDVFYSAPATLYYLPAFVSNWSSTFAGRPTLCWNPTVQRDATFGFASERFSFNISGAPDIPVKIEAATNLASGVWAPVMNAALDTSGSLFVTDPASTNFPSRFYRIVFP